MMEEARPRIFSIWVCVALVAVTWFVFGQTLHFGFVNYDDPEWVMANPHVTPGLTADGIRWAISRFHAGPLSSISHMLDCQVYGLKPWGHHLTNVLFHTAAVLFLFLAFRKMTGATWRSALVAAFFAVHPLRIESVAWVTERKDVLSGLFFALTLLAYVAYARRPSVGRYLIVAGSFALGLLAKGMLITLPVVLLLLDFWPLERFRDRGATIARLGMEKLPLVLLSLGGAVATYLTHAQGETSFQAVPLMARLSNAIVSLVIYIRQTFYPAGLAAFYGFVENRSPSLVAFALALLVGISVAAVKWRRQFPYLFVGWFWYLLMLLPVSGVLQIGLQGHADRYTYLPQIGLLLVIVWGCGDLVKRHRQLAAAVSVLSVVICATTARNLAGSWRDSESLWNRAIAIEPNNEFAHTSLADLLLREGRVTDAISHAEVALRVNSNNPDAHNNLALALSRTGHLSEAIAHWERGLEFQPGNLNARCNLAWALSANPKASTNDGVRAVALVEPVAAGSGGLNTTALQVLAAAYARSGRYEEAVAVAEKARNLARRQGNQGFADQMQANSDQYRGRQPLVDAGLVDVPIAPPALLTRPN